MARKPKTTPEPAAPSINVDNLIEQAVAILGPQAEARTALDDAKQQVSATVDGSVRGFVEWAAGINEPLDKTASKALADGIATRLYKTGVKNRASELLTMITMKSKLREILQGVDANLEKMREDNEKAVLNIRTEVLAIARVAKKSKQDIQTIVAERLKKKTQQVPDEERVGRLLENLANEKAFNDTVGDGQLVLKPRAKEAFAVLWAMNEGRDPDEEEEDLPEQETEDPSQVEQEPLEGPQEAPEPEPQPEPTPDETPAPSPAQGQGEALLGMGVDELLGETTEKKQAQG